MLRRASWMLAASMGCMVAAPGSAGATAEAIVAEPAIFAPGAISGPAAEDSAAFTADGNTVYFDRIRWPNAAIMESHRVGDGWSAPRLAAFSGEWLDHDPAMAPDGSFLVFSSNRPDRPGAGPIDAVQADGKVSKGSGGHLWRVDRKGDGWAAPVRLPDAVNTSTRTFAPSVARDGSVYFQRSGSDGDFRLYRSAYRQGRYETPVEVMLGDPSAHKLDPAVAPDESFIVFDANFAGKDAPDRLYIAFREGGHWGTPVDLGDAINRGSPWGAHLGPDHRTLYFSSARATPVHYPRTRAQGEQDMARMQAWDNGNDNLWSVSLAPWLEAHARAAGSKADKAEAMRQ